MKCANDQCYSTPATGQTAAPANDQGYNAPATDQNGNAATASQNGNAMATEQNGNATTAGQNVNAMATEQNGNATTAGQNGNAMATEQNGNATTATSATMYAEQIIGILRQQPDLLQSVKDSVAQQTGMDPSTISDDALYNRIRQDADLRARVTKLPESAWLQHKPSSSEQSARECCRRCGCNPGAQPADVTTNARATNPLCGTRPAPGHTADISVSEFTLATRSLFSTDTYWRNAAALRQ